MNDRWQEWVDKTFEKRDPNAPKPSGPERLFWIVVLVLVVLFAIFILLAMAGASAGEALMLVLLLAGVIIGAIILGGKELTKEGSWFRNQFELNEESKRRIRETMAANSTNTEAIENQIRLKIVEGEIRAAEQKAGIDGDYTALLTKLKSQLDLTELRFKYEKPGMQDEIERMIKLIKTKIDMLELINGMDDDDDKHRMYQAWSSM